MTNETNPGTVEKLRDRLEAIVSQPEATGFANMKASLTRHDFRQIIAALAAQSQPAATVQEVGREALELCREVLPRFVHSVSDEDKHVAGREALRAVIAALTAEPAAKAGDDKLPCDIKLPPATLIRAGCSFETLRVALSNPNRPKHFPETAAERQARAVMMPQSGSATAPSGGQSYGMLSGCMDFTEPSPPSPQPDMGSGEAIKAILEDCFEPSAYGIPRVNVTAAANRILATLSPPASQSVEKMTEALSCVDGDWEWLCDQLEQYPNRVHPDRTTSDSYLRESAAKIIRAALSLPHKEEATPATTTERGRG